MSVTSGGCRSAHRSGHSDRRPTGESCGPDRCHHSRRLHRAGIATETRKDTARLVVLARYAANRRLGDALHLQAFSALVASPGARAYYDALRAGKIGHHAALRQLANRLVGILHGCLKTGTKYDENNGPGNIKFSLPLDTKRHGMSVKLR
jgi:hypothetical protein